MTTAAPAKAPAEHKRCRRCEQDKPLAEFYVRTDRGTPYSPCKACVSKRQQERMAADPVAFRARKRAYDLARREANPEKVREAERGYKVKNKYGLSLEEYDALMAEGCRLCGSFNKLGMDHCHASGKVRAPLCRSCNGMLGMAQDDPDLLRAGIEYLELHSGR